MTRRNTGVVRIAGWQAGTTGLLFCFHLDDPHFFAFSLLAFLKHMVSDDEAKEPPVTDVSRIPKHAQIGGPTRFSRPWSEALARRKTSLGPGLAGECWGLFGRAGRCR